VQPQRHGLRPGGLPPLDDRLADPERTFHGEHGLALVRPDLHAVARTPGRDLEPGGLVLGCITAAGHGDAADDEEENEKAFHTSPLAWAFVVVRLTPGERVGNTPKAIVARTADAAARRFNTAYATPLPALPERPKGADSINRGYSLKVP
jgi:hypothetical protein